ncbi:DUF6132 family protein [Capnocytophaga stomatis]|uniref:DUF6132 family protein n=1 Tax=Capnocytophaga stomatis TaxID=1848904 RepID=A0ABW8Q9P5_9FLAO|nr:DUF6132 family protein [Capnocytophaga stomatis]GIJ94581.1 hypothetical protein CAPN002_17990 [Capnocytophaga stomatis]GIJ96968.1 hypothetical protein CAPN001_15370 [Capnocytophaga stomatis]
MKYLIKNKWIIIGVFLGAIAGYLYYYYIGCASGTCAITSNPLNSTLYGAVMGGLLLSILVPTKKNTKMLKEVAPKAVVIDVRTPSEFQSGHFENSVNIPLDEIPNRIAEIKAFNKPVICCCRSGIRSQKATKHLQNQGIECYNGGSWQEVKDLY